MKPSLALAVLLWVGAPLVAAPIDGAMKKLRRGKYDSALKELRKLAEHGEAEAQFALGTLYALGGGVERDDCKALRWLQSAAGQGHTTAQFNLFRLYEAGNCRPDSSVADGWLERAADAGHAEAQYTLGYRLSKGEDADRRESAQWLLRAAEQGHAKAQARLGYLLTNGALGAADYPAAHSWFARAAESPDAAVSEDARQMKRRVEVLMTNRPPTDAQSLRSHQ